MSLAIPTLVAAISVHTPEQLPTHDLATGQCRPASEVKEVLSREKQTPIIVGNRAGYGDGIALLFFSNGDGSRGYLLRSNKPYGELASSICVESVFQNIRLSDISKPGIPKWAKLGGNPDEANAICKRDHLGYQENCVYHDDGMENSHSHGDRVMFMATGSAINPRDKTIRQGQTITLILNPTKQSGLVNATTPEGACYTLSGYAKGAYTEPGEKMLMSNKFD